MFTSWLHAFVCTQLVELICGICWYLIFLRSIQIELKKLSLLIFIATLMTHPLLWFCITPLCLSMGISLKMYWILGEGYVFLIEGFWYKENKLKHAFTFSFFLNFLSYQSPFILNKVYRNLLQIFP